MNGFKISVDKSFPYMNDTINFLENIYMMDGYDLWINNENVSLSNVKNDINSKMKMDIISEAKKYNKRYASFIGSSLNTPLNEAYFSSNMISETKSYIKKFINGLNNIVHIDENEDIRKFSYKHMMNCYKYLNEVDEKNDPQNKVNNAVNDIGASASQAADEINKNKNKLDETDPRAAKIAMDAEKLKKETDEYKKEQEKKREEEQIQQNDQNQQIQQNSKNTQNQQNQQIKSGIQSGIQNSSSTSQKMNNVNSSVTYPHYKNLKRILEDEEDTSTQNLKEEISKKIQDHINAGTDMNRLWVKIQDEVPLTKGLTFTQAMEKYNNNGVLSQILKALKI